MCRPPPPLLIQTSGSLWLAQGHSSLYTVSFDTKKWVEEREGRWEEGGERWLEWIGGKKNENDSKIIKGPFPPTPMSTNECTKQNIKYHQTERAIINYNQDNSRVVCGIHPKAVFTWTAQGASPVPQGWHRTVLMVLWAWVHPVVPANFHFSSAVHCQFQWQRVSVYLQQRFYYQHFYVLSYHIGKENGELKIRYQNATLQIQFISST